MVAEKMTSWAPGGTPMDLQVLLEGRSTAQLPVGLQYPQGLQQQRRPQVQSLIRAPRPTVTESKSQRPRGATDPKQMKNCFRSPGLRRIVEVFTILYISKSMH